MPRPKKPVGEKRVPISVRLHPTGLARVERIAGPHDPDCPARCTAHRDTDRTETVTMLMALGMAAWDRGARPPIKTR